MLKYIQWSDLTSTEKEAREGERGRAMFRLHTQDSDPLHRMVNIMTPRTYVPPHKHENPDKREVFVCLRGKVAVIEFNEQGTVLTHRILTPQGPTFAVEIPPRTWHTFVCLEDPTYLFEVKDGPWDPATDKHSANGWAPREDDRTAGEQFNLKLIKQLHLEVDDD